MKATALAGLQTEPDHTCGLGLETGRSERDWPQLLGYELLITSY